MTHILLVSNGVTRGICVSTIISSSVGGLLCQQDLVIVDAAGSVIA